MVDEYTTIIIKRQFDKNDVQQYTITDYSAMHNIEEFVEVFIRPMLRVLGYSDKTINTYFDEE